MIKYVISKSSRSIGPVSYNGPTWDNAGLRGWRKDLYDDREEALALATLLSKTNPVGFVVDEVKVKEDQNNGG